MFKGDRIENRETDQSFSKRLESNDARVRSEDMKNERWENYPTNAISISEYPTASFQCDSTGNPYFYFFQNI